MSPRWKRLESPPTPTIGPVYLDAVLRPNRSLSRAGFLLMFGVFALFNLIVSIVFAVAGAYPVAGFMGLDVLLVAVAFYANYRGGRARERVLVAADRLHVWREPAPTSAKSSGEGHWIVHPQWVRIEPDEKALRLAAGGSSVPVAACLSPEERDHFALALADALHRARNERWPG